MESRPSKTPKPETQPDSQIHLPFKGRERLLTQAQLGQLRSNLVWSYLTTIGLSFLTLKAVDTLTHSVLEGRIGTALINTTAVLALGGVTAVIGRMSLVATGWYASDLSKRIKNHF